MNKRIQKKVAKREGMVRETSNGNAAHASPGKPSPAVRAVAEQAEKKAHAAGPVGMARALAEQVQERTTEAIGQVRDQVREKIAETKSQVRDQVNEKIAETKTRISEGEEQAEALLEKVPLVGAAAAKKLHDLTHR
jgi:hypothetical protein